MKNIAKIQDTFNDQKSAADIYWTASNIQRFYKMFRKPMDLPKTYLNDTNSIQSVQKRYSIRGFQFGNWVTTEDRFNYMAALYICFYDLQKVLKFNDNNIGLSGSLGIAFGSRGVPNALAHYEPANVVINLSRYKREDVIKKQMEALGMRPPAKIPKEVLFMETGGIGSFAHEYGHFLDGQFGLYSEPNTLPYLTGKRGSVSKDRIDYPAKDVMRNIVEDFFQQVFWVKPKQKTKYALRLEATESDYLQNRQEIFARAFEQYISEKLAKIGITNEFIVKKKYKAIYYLKPAELKPIIPILDKLILEMRKRS